MPAKITIQDIHALAKKQGGKCLSKKYIGNAAKLKWQCADGHTWEASAAYIKTGYWCTICRNEKKLKYMHNLAKKQGGQCLSKQYINVDSKLKWQCAKGHIFERTRDDIIRNRWCPTCARKR
jgi:hypothetical protein